MTQERQIEFEGRTYKVVTDETKINEPFSLYAQVYHVRKDGSQGKRLITLSIVNALVEAAERNTQKEADRWFVAMVSVVVMTALAVSFVCASAWMRAGWLG